MTNSNNLFSDKQFGFIGGRSTSLQLLTVLDKWTKILDKGGTIHAIYMDFMKAFDKVPYRRLIAKPHAGPGQTNRPDAPIPCAVSKNLANRDATCLPWVDTRKPEKRVLEVEGHARDLHMYQHTSLITDSV